MLERKAPRSHIQSQSGDADAVYFNVTINGSPEIGAGDPSTIASTDITRSQPIISDTRSYYASVIRATVPLALAPILVIPHVGNTDVTPYVLSIRFGAAYITSTPLIWQPEMFGAEAAAKDLRYHMRSYDSFSAMVNAAVATCFVAFAAANPGAPQAIAGVVPFVYFDATNDEFVWVYNGSWNSVGPVSATLGATEARVCVNASLLSVFDGWRMVYPGDTISPDNYAQYIWQNTGANAYTLNGIVGSFFSRPTCDQIEMMSSIRRIIITSSNLPVVQEGLPAIGSLSNASTTAATLAVVADYVPQISSGGDPRSIAYFIPEAQYRLMPLISDDPLTRIQISFWWQAASGELYPILIPRGQQVSCKIAFLKRAMYKQAD